MSRILVVDDSAEMRELLLQTLKGAGYEVGTAISGRDAIEQFRASPFDLIITDIYMPDKDGLEIIMEFQRDFPDVPIIAMCGKMGTVRAMLSVARQLGATDVLPKPFFTHELLAKVDKVVGTQPHV